MTHTSLLAKRASGPAAVNNSSRGALASNCLKFPWHLTPTMQRVPTKVPTVIITLCHGDFLYSRNYLPKQRGEVKIQDKGFSQRSIHKAKGSPMVARKLLKRRELLKAAVGIEPTNKGFAGRIGHFGCMRLSGLQLSSIRLNENLFSVE